MAVNSETPVLYSASGCHAKMMPAFWIWIISRVINTLCYLSNFPSFWQCNGCKHMDFPPLSHNSISDIFNGGITYRCLVQRTKLQQGCVFLIPEVWIPLNPPPLYLSFSFSTFLLHSALTQQGNTEASRGVMGFFFSGGTQYNIINA